VNINELFDKFYERYERPVIEELVIGFSGIDPPLKPSAGRKDHEILDNLLGGDDTGHYHLTKEQIEKLLAIVGESYPPRIGEGQVITINADEEMTPIAIQIENGGQTNG
jgi:hypothetical protein